MTEGKEKPALQDVGEYFVGVTNGDPLVEKCGDSVGDCEELTLYPKAEDALARFHNVRRVRLMIDNTPVRAPQEWGRVEDGE